MLPFNDKIILYSLDHSRSTRVVWLLESLDLPYEIKAVKRDEKYRAPQSLKKVHPLGRVPIVEIHSDGAKPIVLAESGHICRYLIERYDTEKKFKFLDPIDQVLADYYGYYVEGTFHPLLVAVTVLAKTYGNAPYVVKPMLSVANKILKKFYYVPEVEANLSFLDEQLAANGTGYFVGNKYSIAEILLSFTVAEKIYRNKEEFEEWTAIDTAKYKHLAKWAQALLEDPSYVKAKAVEDKVLAEI